MNALFTGLSHVDLNDAFKQAMAQARMPVLFKVIELSSTKLTEGGAFYEVILSAESP